MPEDAPQRVAAILAAHRQEKGALLPVLHDIQAAFGYVPPFALPLIADALNLSRADVHGVVTFYHDFRHAPAGRHVLRLCRAEACQARGAAHVAAHTRALLGIDWHETTLDGAISLEPVFCLGLCASGPAAMLDERPLAALSPAAVDRLLEQVA